MATDDFPGATSVTDILTEDAPLVGSLSGTGGKDWYKISLKAGQSYYFDLEGSSSDKGSLRDPYLYLYDETGKSLGSNDDIGDSLNARVVFTAYESGYYYLGAGSANTDAAGSFSLSAHGFEAEHPMTSMGTVEVGGSVTGDLKVKGDSGWFRITLTAGHAYQIDLQGDSTGQGTLHDPMLYLYDSDGNLLTYDDDSGLGWRNSQVTYAPSVTGAYYLDAAGYKSGSEGTYNLSACELPDGQIGGTATLGSISVGGSATGQLDRDGDHDWFQVSLEAGKSYYLTLAGGSTLQGSLQDPYLYVYDSDGNRIAGDDDGGWYRNSRLVFTATASGTYYLDAAGFDDKETGTYTLATEELPNATSDGSQPQGRLTSAGLVHGKLEDGGDRDWYPISLSAYTHYYFTLEGTGSGQGALDGPMLELYDSSGQSLAWDSQDVGDDGVSRAQYTAESDGVYYVDAASLRADSGGSYRLSVVGLALDDFQGETNLADTSVQDPFYQAMADGSYYPSCGIAIPLPTVDTSSTASTVSSSGDAATLSSAKPAV